MRASVVNLQEKKRSSDGDGSCRLHRAPLERHQADGQAQKGDPRGKHFFLLRCGVEDSGRECTGQPCPQLPWCLGVARRRKAVHDDPRLSPDTSRSGRRMTGWSFSVREEARVQSMGNSCPPAHRTRALLCTSDSWQRRFCACASPKNA